MASLLTFTKKGIYCPAGDFYIDPWRPVKRAIITHGHSDHARWGMDSYLAHQDSEPILKLRLGSKIPLQTIDYHESISINGVKVSLHPAGHIIGSAQVRVEHRGEVWVASGDYKTHSDPVATDFEPVKCNAFITESTFGLPVYRWRPEAEIMQEINAWWKQNQSNGKTSVIFAYSLGKAQRIIAGLDQSIGTIFTHGAVENTNQAFREFGIALPPTTLVHKDIPKASFKGNMVIAPPSASGNPWMRNFNPYVAASASGWMALRGARRRRNMDKGFVLSDHADWDGLLTAIKETGCSKVIVTHGYTDIFARYLNELGYDASTEKTEFSAEGDDSNDQTISPEP